MCFPSLCSLFGSLVIGSLHVDEKRKSYLLVFSECSIAELARTEKVDASFFLDSMRVPAILLKVGRKAEHYPSRGGGNLVSPLLAALDGQLSLNLVIWAFPLAFL